MYGAATMIISSPTELNNVFKIKTIEETTELLDSIKESSMLKQIQYKKGKRFAFMFELAKEAKANLVPLKDCIQYCLKNFDYYGMDDTARIVNYAYTVEFIYSRRHL